MVAGSTLHWFPHVVTGATMDLAGAACQRERYQNQPAGLHAQSMELELRFNLLPSATPNP